MAILKKSATKKARIEIIPLIDVIFFLLATFVLFTLSLNKLQSIPIDLPQATASQSTAEPDVLVIQVSDQGTLFWNREPVNRDQVPNLLTAYIRTKPDPRVLVAGDQKALYGPAIEILDLVRKAGVKKVSIETQVRGTGR